MESRGGKPPNRNQSRWFREHSHCSVAFGEASKKPLNEQIDAALSVLKPQRALLPELTHTGGVLSFFSGLFCDDNTGDSLPGPVFEAMADLGIGLDLDIYVPEGTELLISVAGTSVTLDAGELFRGSSGLHIATACQAASPLYGSDRIAPAIGGFYFWALGRSVTLPASRYNNSSHWTSTGETFTDWNGS
jgi:hypothetical protein